MSQQIRSGKGQGTSAKAPARRPLAHWIAAALAVGAMQAAHAGTPPVLSAAWLSQRQNLPANAAGAPSAGVSIPGLGAQTSGQLLQQKVVQQSIANLNNAAQAVAAQMAAQQQAAQKAQQLAGSPVPNGLTPGGLQVAANGTWQNVNAPTQSTANGQVTVDVKQTAQKAIATWDSFNVGRQTTVHFDQTGGTQSSGANDWIVLNRVLDPSGVPSQIFGQIKAEGTVYLLNRNGILFGAGSQVNTRSFLASSLDLFSSDVATSNSRFMSGGIADLASTQGVLTTDGVLADMPKYGDVVIEQGASVTTGAQGFALVAAPNVSNAGAIIADDGQAILAAGSQFNQLSASSSGGQLDLYNAGTFEGTATNTGLIQSRRGQIHVLGHDIDQAGVVLASTSISYPGSVELTAASDGVRDSSNNVAYQNYGALNLASGSVTAVLPEKDGATTSSSQAADDAFVPSSVNLLGHSVTFGTGSLLEAPGADLSITARMNNLGGKVDTDPTAGRIYVDDGAIIDVSGLANVELPMSALLVTIPRIGQNELADSPLLRNSFLYTQKNVVVDSSQSGTRADGLDWIGSPILNVGGYVENVPRTVDQLLTKGGGIKMTGDQVVVRSGSQLNLDGGYVAYQPGWVSTPNLLGADGRVYNIADADPDVYYVGFAGQYTMDHSRWGVSETWSNPLLAGATRWDSGFIVGGDAGALTIKAGSALILDGEIDAQAFAGRNQVAQSEQPEGGTLNIGGQATFVANAATQLGLLLKQSTADLDDLDPDFDADSPWSEVLDKQDSTATPDDDLRLWLPVSADMVARSGFQNVNLDMSAPDANSPGVLDSPAPLVEQAGTRLSVGAGGSITLKGSRVTVLGELDAPAGSIDLEATGSGSFQEVAAGEIPSGDILIGSGAVLNVDGLWINDSGLAANQVVGNRYINGGSISLTSNQHLDVSGTKDASGSIVLERGSLLDASSGGYVGTDGQIEMTNGVPDGHGGDISLITYAGSAFQSGHAPSTLDSGSLVLDGTLRAYGFSGGGTLTLQAPLIQIGGDPADMALANGLYLAPEFFAGQGFANYELTAITDATIAPGSKIRITNDNLLPDYQELLAAPTGADLYAVDTSHPDGVYAQVGQLDAYHRYVTDKEAIADGQMGFSLSAGAYLNWNRGTSASSGSPQYEGVTGSVLMGKGADIQTDAGAAVTLDGMLTATVLGTINAPGGTIDIVVGDHLTRTAGLPTEAMQIWLGTQASLNASGVSLLDPWAAAVTGTDGIGFTPRTGVVLNGGSVSLASNGGYVLAEAGSLIDVSGTSDMFDLPTGGRTGLGGAGTLYVPTQVWSDAGSIELAASAGLYFDGALQAYAGATQAEGGSLSLIGLANQAGAAGPSATGILLQQSGNMLPAGLKPGQSPEVGVPSGILHFALDRLDNSGITSLTIGPDPSSTPGFDSAVPIGFAGNIDLNLGRSFIANASAYIALPTGSTSLVPQNSSYAQGNGTVRIAAPYVNLSSSLGNGNAPIARAGDGVLQIDADFIDLGGWLDFQQWAQVGFTSSGDIRFYLPPLSAYLNGVVQPGLLFTTGDLTFKAAQLYPASDYAFVIDANPSDLKDAQGQQLSTTVTILPNGTSEVPLSAGGALLIDADHIEQEGTIRVPSGNLVLGVQDPATDADSFGLANTRAFPLVDTSSVHLAPGSITSVALDGITVPFGSTVDGTDWSYSGDPNASSPDLTGPPAKQITINGTDVSLDKGATIDLSGGGHLQSAEWVPGVGGTRDVLSQSETDYTQSTSGTQVSQYPDGRAVYAIVPGYEAPVGAHDAVLEKGAGDGPAVGQAVYLSGIPGLPAGIYTLLPAKYATLPGAYRLVQNTSAQDSVLGRNAALPDGTLAVTGYFADALDGARSSRSTTFLVQSEAVWQQYSQYDIQDADAYFGSLATKAGSVVPPLPQDAGHLILAAGHQLDLGTTLTAAPAEGGRGSEVDIAAQAIQVVSPGGTAQDGYLAIDAGDLTTLGAGSLLLGGKRQASADGDLVDTIADGVVIANDAEHPLAGQEILLVAKGDGTAEAPGVLLESGSDIRAQGTSDNTSSQPLIFGSNATTDANGNPIAAVNGSGALLRISQSGAASVVREGLPADDTPNTAGALTIQAGATIDGGSALTLDATGKMQVDPTATFSAKAIDANSSLITFAGNGSNVDPTTAGLVIGPNTLALFTGAQSVILRSRSVIDFDGNVAVDLPNTLELDAGAFISDGGAVNLTAGTLALGNGLGASAPSFNAGSGSLVLNANEVDFKAGQSTLQGFGSAVADASQGIAGQGTGGIDFGSLDVTLNTPLFMAESGADTSLSTTGTLTIVGNGGTPFQRSSLGGALNLTGGSLVIGTDMEAPAGNLSLEATSGALTVASGALLDVAGINKTFFDTNAYAAGGALSLTADSGDVDVQAGTSLSFGGAPQGGDAGSLTIDAGGQALLNGQFDGHAAVGYRGSFFTLNSGGEINLDSMAQLTKAAGTTGAIVITSGAGNLILSAGNTLQAQNVYLEARGGSGGPSAADGNVIIDGTVDVSGEAAGNLQLYGRSGVDVEGNLLATSSIPEQRGGNVSIGTTGVADGTLNATYGYENVQAPGSGSIHLGAEARIDVSGGSADAGGTVDLRAPLLADGGVSIGIDGSGSIAGARSVIIEPYAVWSTADDASVVGAAKHFDGLIDPAGWYQYGADGKSVMVAGTWTDASGNVLPAPSGDDQLKQYLSEDYFTPDAANDSHESFYGYVNGDPSQGPGALMGFVEAPGFSFDGRFAGITNLHIRPGIELENPDAGINGGNISVLTNWNLGAGITNGDGTINLAYRYHPAGIAGYGEAPIISILALNNVDIQASVSDGFYQQNDGAVLSAPAAASNADSPAYDAALAAYDASNTYLLNDAFFPGDLLWQTGQLFTSDGGLTDLNSDKYYQPVMAPQAGQSDAYYSNYMSYINAVGAGNDSGWEHAYNNGDNNLFLPYNPTSKVAPQPGSYGNYSDYVSAYLSWLRSNFDPGNIVETPSPLLLPLQAEAQNNYGLYSTDYTSYIGGFDNYYNYVSTQVSDGVSSQLFYAPYVPVGNAPPIHFANNSPSNMPSLNNPASFASATLLGGSSSSYRLVAGADFPSANPLSVRSAEEGDGNINLDGHFAVADTTTVDESGNDLPSVDNKTLLFPTTIRTGTGSIDIAAAGDIDWQDAAAPTAVYTAGEPSAGTTADTGVSVLRPSIVGGTSTSTIPDMVVTGQVNPVNGGDISLAAGGNINGIEQVYDTDGSVTGTKGNYIGQFWWPWMQTGNTANSSSINFAEFDQGVMSVGGNVSIGAGGDIRELSVSLPTTWYANADGQTVTTVGGGNLDVQAGGDILSGSYFVARGTGTIEAGGAIGPSGFDYTVPSSAVGGLQGTSTPVSTILAMQDAQLDVSARQGADIGGVYDPSYYNDANINAILPVGHFDSQSYGVNSSLAVTSTGGDLVMDSLSVPGYLFGYGSKRSQGDAGSVLPASLEMTSLSGDLDILGPGGLYPSATGNLSLLADGSINFSQQVYTTQGQSFGLIDSLASLLPSAEDPTGTGGGSNIAAPQYWGYLSNYNNVNLSSQLHQVTPLHGDDNVPVRIYALTGDVNDGIIAPNGFQYRSLVIAPDKQTLLYAGRDIVNLSFLGQQVHDADVTRIAAGRDVYDTALPGRSTNFSQYKSNGYELVPSLVLGGVGSFLVEAGRDIGPLANEVQVVNSQNTAPFGTGIATIGNQNNNYLPHEGADVNVLFGVGPGMDTSAFLSTYLDPIAGVDGFGSLAPDLVDFMERREEGAAVDTGYAQDKLDVVLTSGQARAAFDQLPDYVQRLFVEQELFKMLAQVGANYNDPTSPYFGQYARGYAALGTLFPASLGYTDNGAGQGGLNGTAPTVDTGDLDIRSSTIQTQQGGNVTILGPGGQALVGSASAPPVITSGGHVVAGPNTMGVLTLEQGDVNIFTDRSLLLAQSRIFTEQGGDMTIWSSNGDINAGQGAKTTSEIPPPTYLCTVDAYCLIDARGQVSGAGIATLQTIPGGPTGNVYLVAPRGTVDAGDAGIRVSGNVVIAAARVLNADNIQVQGEKVGIPTVASVNTSALTSASAAASAVGKVADDMARQQQNDARSNMPSIISVQVLGFGGGDSGASVQNERQGPAYDTDSPVQVLGVGHLGGKRKAALTIAEQQQLTQ